MDVKAWYPDKLGLNLRKIHPKGNTMMRHQESPTQKSEHFLKIIQSNAISPSQGHKFKQQP